jgi:hypothetical protein
MESEKHFLAEAKDFEAGYRKGVTGTVGNKKIALEIKPMEVNALSRRY